MSAEHPGRCNGVALDVNEDVPAPAKSRKGETNECFTFPFVQKLIAEVAGTYFLLFSGCMSVVVNKNHDNVIGLVGISIVWGLVVTVLIYSVGHISGAHFNPAVTFAFATCGRFPWKQVVPYWSAQVLASLLANGTLRLLFTGKENQFAGTQPAGSDMQAFVIEFIITFYLMFIVSGVATDNRAIGELAGLAIGATVLLNVIFAGAITGASMNPARSLGPAVLHHHYKGLWIYILAPTLGAVAGAWVYNLIRFTDKPLREITKSGSFLKSLNRNGSSAT
ncbi:aquaporin NIP1-1-like isoform X1 [Punica granatum]|uniref:Uncharacterized protein n=2 Tax=Punica granatum TaxID=22663 RepID=A0A218WJL2_PUNGR|nr:aquaporin NIP1-1-like isoform X1 [Punica granatum]OWM72995.1 hypothetical protein CDL15_Pgr001109 [Punica granatum]PKI69047.1 hypothetical protein CRG98_010516 [Punica granatum]